MPEDKMAELLARHGLTGEQVAFLPGFDYPWLCRTCERAFEHISALEDHLAANRH